MTETPEELRLYLDEVFLWMKKEHPRTHPVWKTIIAAAYTEMWNQGYRFDSGGSWYRPTDSGREYISPVTVTVGTKQLVLG